MTDAPDRLVRIRERGSTTVSLSRLQALELRAMNVCSVQPTTSPAEWVVSDVRSVGNIALDGARVVIDPKVPLRSILYMASVADRQVNVTDAHFEVAEERDIPTAITAAFISAVEQATKRGLSKGYRTAEESAMVVRGRWDVSRQLRTRPGMPLPVELTIDDFTEDTDENRMLATALAMLRRLDFLPPDLEDRCLALQALFAEVTTLRPGERMPIVRPTRLNARLQFPLFLAGVLLTRASWTTAIGAHRAGTFLIDMAQVFEAFVGVTLERKLAPRGFIIELQDQRSWRFDEAGQIILRPDIVIRDHGTRIVVADTKYKTWGTGGSPPNADVYQATAYALAAGLKESHLIYVNGDVESATYDIRSASLRIYAHSLPLDGAPSELDAAIARLGEDMVTSARTFGVVVGASI